MWRSVTLYPSLPVFEDTGVTEVNITEKKNLKLKKHEEWLYELA